MKKIISLLLILTLAFVSTFTSFATVTNNIQSLNIIEETVSNLILTKDGMVNINKTLNQSFVKKYSIEDIIEMETLLTSLNLAMKQTNYFINEDKMLISKYPSFNSITPFYQGSYEYISPGAYDTGDNYVNVYCDKYQTQEMINIREAFASPALIVELLLLLLKSVPVAVILTVAQDVASTEVNQISAAFDASGKYGVYYRYWRYSSGTKSWNPWFPGQVVGSNWTRLY